MSGITFPWCVPVLTALVVIVVLLCRVKTRRLKSGYDHALAERVRTAREAHDTLLKGFSGVTVQMQALWSRLPASPEKQRLGAIIADAGKCCARARRSDYSSGTKRTA
ncbi:MAG TPA: histidine kinase [Bryobacteraceae bacterium]